LVRKPVPLFEFAGLDHALDFVQDEIGQLLSFDDRQAPNPFRDLGLPYL